MTAFLPAQDPNPAPRNMQLEAARRAYQYNYTHVSPLALVERVPIHDEFSFKWLCTVSERVMVGLENTVACDMEETFRAHHLQQHKMFRKLLDLGKAEIVGLKQLVSDALKFEPRLGASFRHADRLEDYNELFQKIDLPPIAKDVNNDAAFAWMRVGGPNPIMLRQYTQKDERFPVTDADFAVTGNGDSLDAALGEGRLFLADYQLLDGAGLGDYPHGQKYVYAPLALFVIDKESRKLTPVAIQCKQQPAKDNPIFTPADGYNWLIAKTIVEIADGNVHEARTHLGRTHLLMEPFVVTTFRQLALNHPLARLLTPHFEGTLAINEAAWKHLIANKGAVEKLFGANIASARALAANGVTDAAIRDIMLPYTFAERNVEDPDLLPEYPYRDDALLYWHAIHEWVSSYVGCYYNSAADVQGDAELQNWARELTSNEGGRIRGLGKSNAIQDVEDLVSTLTLVIYTCSVQHAAVNFPQYDLMSYVPIMPLASYIPAPTEKSDATEQDFLKMLPPMDMARLQMDLGYLLGTIHYTQLGQYPKNQFDPALAEPLQRFQQQIASIGQTIDERNQSRRPYEFLRPSGVPQSINI